LDLVRLKVEFRFSCYVDGDGIQVQM